MRCTGRRCSRCSRAAWKRSESHRKFCFSPAASRASAWRRSGRALAEKMAAAGGDRSSIVIAFGGGIVGDLAGFLAAIFMRGIPVIQVPTTLLAQVDAAVGGKTGANLTVGKNLIGSFHQPLAVWIDPDVLKTLPEREYRAGLYEIVKCGVIRDAALFDSDGPLRRSRTAPGTRDCRPRDRRCRSY